MYKVVRKMDDKYYETSINNTVSIIEYKVNEWVSPLVSHTRLFVFNTLENAKVFLDKYFFNYKEYYIFECEVKNPIPYRELCNHSFRPIERWDVFNSFIKRKKRAYYPDFCPTGTVFASAVKIKNRCV